MTDDSAGTAPAKGTESSIPASVARIRRLEQMEVERLEAKGEREERRLRHVARGKDARGNHDTVERVESWTKYPMTVLGLAWLVLLIADRSVATKGTSSTVVVSAFFAIWVLLFVEYGVRLILSPNRAQYVRQRWAEPVTVIVPFTQGWHLVGIEKVTLVLHEGALRVSTIMKHHSLFRVLIGAAGVVLLGSWLVLLFERHTPGANIHNYPNALWWALVTVTTVGYGDFFPHTEGGRIVAVVLMLVGIGLIGTLTATVASVFVKEHTDATKAEMRSGHDDLTEQITLISNQLLDIERRLGATPSELATIEQTTEAEVTGESAPDPPGGSSTT